MKYTLLVLGFLVLAWLFTDCKKSEPAAEKQTSITYPAAGVHGPNLLAMADSALVDNQQTYSMSATLQSDAELKIVVTNLSSYNGRWVADSASNTNWNFAGYNSALKQQVFTAKKGSSADVSFMLINTGACRIDFFENQSQTASRIRFLAWQYIP